MAFKVHISNALQNQPGQVTGPLTAAFVAGIYDVVRGDFKVTGTAGMSVNVAKGEAFVEASSYVYGTMDQKLFNFASSATEAVSIGANASGNPRIDLICLKVDTAASPGNQGVSAGSIVAVAGTPGAVPTAPAVPSNHLVIAQIAVANGASVISNAEITDRRYSFVVGGVGGPEGFLINGKLSVTVVSNDLVVAIKTLTGNDPSTAEPVWCRIGDNIVKIITAKSVTAADGTNWGNAGGVELGTKEVDWFAYLGYNITDGVVIGFSRIPYGQRYADFSATTTNPLFCKISTITTASATDKYVNIGRFAATLSLSGTSHLWTVPTFTGTNLINRPVFETRTLTYVPAFSANGGGSFTPSLKWARYKIQGNQVFYGFTTNAHTVSGTVTAIVHTLPIPDGAAATLSGGDFMGPVGQDEITNKILYHQFNSGTQRTLAARPTGNITATAGGGYMAVRETYSLLD